VLGCGTVADLCRAELLERELFRQDSIPGCVLADAPAGRSPKHSIRCPATQFPGLLLLPNVPRLIYGPRGLGIVRVSACSLCVAAALCIGGPLRADPSRLPPEIGYNYSDLETARTAAMGGALRAFSNSLEALQDNPANLAATRVYHMGGMAQFWTGANRQSYGASIVDSVAISSPSKSKMTALTGRPAGGAAVLGSWRAAALFS